MLIEKRLRMVSYCKGIYHLMGKETIAALCLGAAVFFFSYPIFAQKPAMVFRYFSINDGLSENTARAIIEDKKGFMWFGCEDGLNKYDGYEFKSYRNDENNTYTISSRNIKSLYVDSKGRLWVATSSGVNIYDPLFDIFYNFRNDKYAALKAISQDVIGIVEDKQGVFWVATANDGLYKIESLDKASRRIAPVTSDYSKYVSFLSLDTDSTLLLGTRDGLLKFNTRTETFADLRPKYGSGYAIWSIYKGEEGNQYLCTSDGLKIIAKEGTLQSFRYNVKDPHGIGGADLVGIVPYKGNYLIGIDGGGMDYFDVKSQTFYHYTEELSSRNVNSIYKDSKGDIWAGTYLNGINYSNAVTNLVVLKKNNPYSESSIKNGIITNFLKDSNQNLWIATDGGGLYKRSKGATNFTHYERTEKGLPSNVLVSLMEDTKGYIWMTSYGGGLCRYDPVKHAFKTYKADRHNPHSLPNNRTRAVCEYQGKIWVADYGTGYSVLDPTTDKFENHAYDKSMLNAVPSEWVHYFYVDKKEQLWVASFGGLSRYNPLTCTFKNYLFKSKKAKNNVDVNVVMDIIEDNKGNLWLGTTGGGLVCFNPATEKYEVYTTEDGLSNNCIKSVIPDDFSNLWLATNNGITRFNLDTRKGKAYTTNDGLQPCTFYFNSKYKDEQGQIYLGANNGYVVINPSVNFENKKAPPIVITKFKLFDQTVLPGTDQSPLKAEISETSKIQLAYNQNSLSFEFAALNFVSSRNNKYAYRLEGFDDKWFMAGMQRTATYTNLNPGTYVFKVKGSNNENVWNEKGTSITIVITPPFWKTWWFYTALGLAILGFLYLLYAWRTRLIREKNLMLEETVIKRTSELKEESERLETFVYKASHDIKGPLKSIMGLTLIGQKDAPDETTKVYFDHILSRTKKLDDLLMDMLMVVRVKRTAIEKERIDFNAMIADVLSNFQNFPGYEKIKIHTELKHSADFFSDRNLLYSIFQNLTENAIKYLDSRKEDNFLRIKIEVSKSGVECWFEDNGLGIRKEFLNKIFDIFFKSSENANSTGLGLFIVKTSVEKLNGTIEVQSEPGKGSIFHVKLVN